MKMAASGSEHATVIPGGFTVLSLKFREEDAAAHQLCVKEHRVRSEKNINRPQDRTLFILNIPPYCTQSVVTDMFQQFGAIESVELCERPGESKSSSSNLSKLFRPPEKYCFRVGYVVFKKASSVTAVKCHPQSSPLIVSTKERPVKTGIDKWIEQYSQSVIPGQTLQTAVDDFMNEFDRQKKEEERLKVAEEVEEEQEEEEEEGWVKVKKGIRGVKARPHSQAANEKTLRKEKAKSERKELVNFYSWQHRNTQKEHLAELRKKFEEDKQKIALLRAQRKFKPY
ncbi:ribosomal RNA-processing protein 7 homolog A-like [Triplophysa dalaica]|uniref:ribosomal RNA-processing protein 7 homolog A-like n=1 Tax=Triplophysa dalaica TaxID=1582913 RepID=UPI0024DFEF0A|nr:ribosomal RNA-processing protein 7 homolog A-like [Triplophysa dalaica]